MCEPSVTSGFSATGLIKSPIETTLASWKDARRWGEVTLCDAICLYSNAPGACSVEQPGEDSSRESVHAEIYACWLWLVVGVIVDFNKPTFEQPHPESLLTTGTLFTSASEEH
ncbi:hypothetical protein NDU88_002612 [Pleurodeles waltl]|uniref:Uncharacterized protein n=1 Tax=Pleurodeles waltl TaxID=8319 RepID=A0AAV7TNL0_PLEWA|nr:hypothetical protein NDU88_002612 [Pleurodeles waltl]